VKTVSFTLGQSGIAGAIQRAERDVCNAAMIEAWGVLPWGFEDPGVEGVLVDWHVMSEDSVRMTVLLTDESAERFEEWLSE
jgi:hypothetical protein